MLIDINGHSAASERKLGDRAARDPAAARVFTRLGIDYCCRGWQSLEEACEHLGLTPLAVEQAIEAESSRNPEEKSQAWHLLSLQELVDHVLGTYHEPLRPELDRLLGLAAKVARVHRRKDPGLLILEETVADLREDLQHHMQKEEVILFPFICQQRGAQLHGPMSVMHHEHETTGALLTRLRELTGNHQAPEDACPSWRALYSGLQALELSIMQHINFEEHVLFPRGLQTLQGAHV